ncbi:MAG: SPFH domain-containing protein [Planctomycetota bacterium]|nr:SPFH domain-containing protein [Planctomycetota bacterium]
MGLLNFIKNQFIEIIEWLDDTNYTLVWRFPDQDHEIKMGAKLVVREGQAAVFVNEGKIADIFAPGTYTLSTKNMPVLSDLNGWKYGFESPFKAEVYFLNTKQYLDQKWGTSNPILVRDADFGPVRIRAFGIYAFRITDPAMFMREVVGTDGNYTVEEIEGQLKRTLVSSLSTAIVKAKVPVMEIAAHYDELAGRIKEVMDPEFTSLGLGLSKFFIENVSLPPEVEALLDQRSGVGIMGPNVGSYMQMQAAQAMRDAAANPSDGGAGAAMGLGAGFGMANMMAGAMAPRPGVAPAAPGMAPPPPPPPVGAGRFHYSGPSGQGEYTSAEIARLVSANPSVPHHLWSPGWPAWRAWKDVGEISSLVAPPPPPPPA